MLKAKAITVDFSKEKEAGYRRIYSRSPLLTSLAAGWEGVYFAYDYLPPGETPEVFAKQHGIGIFIEMPTPAQAERILDGRFRREKVVQGDIVVNPTGVGHRASWDVGGGVIMLGFEQFLLARAVYERVDSDRVELVPHFATPDPLVYQIGLALKATLENYGTGSRLYAQTMINALIVHLLQHYSSQKFIFPEHSGGLSQYKLQQIIDYIQTNLARNLSLEELANIAQMSSHYFCQLFKQSTGITPHQYVICCRVERAKKLLQQGIAIAQVAQQVGFVDQSHLHRHFKKLVGVTPKTLLKSSSLKIQN
jgi:AraC family transcriptional regulator